eukprot:5334573-Pyramimonas_sp.AAC.1
MVMIMVQQCFECRGEHRFAFGLATEAANRGRRTPHLRKLWLGRQFVRLVPYKLAILSVKYTFSVQGGIAPPLALSLAACGNVWKQPKRPFRKRKP